MKNRVVTFRVTEQTREKLENLARKRRRNTGEPVPIADLIREAVEEKLAREGE